MNFDELKSLQDSFDREHGWAIKTDNVTDLIDMLHRDLVGLVGEIGEFANILKKLALVQDRFDTSDPTHGFEETKMKLTEELIDGLIYIIRIASYLHIDIEKEYLIKLDINRRKYHKYEL